ncbi:MAG TPA: hypothetical protein VHM67_10235, partial [Gemmatimonadaceae bacterium]|nr:hypothetical protein [Gemmatimonadaceae bacterium]
MRFGELAGAERGDDRQFARKRDRRTDLGEGLRMARAGEAKDLKAGALARQGGRSADRSDDQIGERHRHVHRIALALDARHADRRFGDARDVLPTGEIDRREAVGVVTLDADRPAQHSAHRRHR